MLLLWKYFLRVNGKHQQTKSWIKRVRTALFPDSVFGKLTIFTIATLKNDDPDNSDPEEGEGMDDQEERLLQKELRESSKAKKSRASEKQPTGKIVGIIKRNWRAYV